MTISRLRSRFGIPTERSLNVSLEVGLRSFEDVRKEKIALDGLE
jgi:tRNA(Leu) C34 or U34 (ribose-2'-O)-methylase TrmL